MGSELMTQSMLDTLGITFTVNIMIVLVTHEVLMIMEYVRTS